MKEKCGSVEKGLTTCSWDLELLKQLPRPADTDQSLHCPGICLH